MNANELKRLLSKYGCGFASHRGGGSHLTITRFDAGVLRTSQLPMHGKKELGTGLVNKILKDLGLKGNDPMMRYAIRLKKDDNGTFLVTSRDFPELATYGETEDDALRHARDAIEEAIAARLAMGRSIPAGKGVGRHVVTLAPDIELKLRLNRIVASLGLSKSAAARSLGLHRPQVDRLFDLRHETRSADLLDAFRRLGYSVNYRVSVAPLPKARGRGFREAA